MKRPLCITNMHNFISFMFSYTDMHCSFMLLYQHKKTGCR